MRLRGVVALMGGAAVALGVPGTVLGSTLVGTYTDGNVQGANSSQAAINGSGGGEFSGPGLKFVEGNSTPNLKQDSTNLADNAALVGGGGGAVIGNASQGNNQAINSAQGAKKGTQISTNVESGTAIIGLQAGDAIIGSPVQASDQAENSSQLAAGLPGAVITAILGPTNRGPVTETSTNLLVSCQVVIGSPLLGC